MVSRLGRRGISLVRPLLLLIERLRTGIVFPSRESNMCMICIEFQKQRMTTAEARRALGEMVEQLDADHVDEVEQMLEEADKDDGDQDDNT